MQNDFLAEMQARGFVNQTSNLDGLAAAMRAGKITAYLGSDPTADSLHVGHLVPVMMMRWLQKFGHKPILLVGGATGRIGDPSGRDSGRPMMTEEILQKNIAGLKKSYSKFIPDVTLVDNYDWHKNFSHMGFLSQFGTDFTVPHMLSMESVKRRLASGMSFLEFNYMTFQAVDFLELYKNHGCVLQTCGADQWGNAIMGVELVRKKLGKEVFVLSTSLITDSNGNKIGKSAGNAVWVNDDKTSPYEYYQYFRNTPDDLVEKFLKIFTEIGLDEIAQLMDGDINDAKVRLALAATEIAHGRDATERAQNEIPVVRAPAGKLADIVAIVYALSKSEARRNIEQGGITVSDAVVKDPNQVIANGEYIFQKGKKKMFTRVVVSDQ